MTSSIKYYLFNTSFGDLDLGRGSQDQHKAKSAGFIFFLNTFQLIRMKFVAVLKSVQGEHPSITSE